MVGRVEEDKSLKRVAKVEEVISSKSHLGYRASTCLNSGQEPRAFNSLLDIRIDTPRVLHEFIVLPSWFLILYC